VVVRIAEIQQTLSEGISMTETKVCKRCGEEKELTKFKLYDNEDIHTARPWCNKCLNIAYAASRSKRIIIYHTTPLEKPTGTVCDIIRHHHEEMKDDPERLSTEFIQTLVGRKC